MPNKNTNPVIEIYKGMEVKTTNLVTLKLSPIEFKELIDIEIDTGLSLRKIIGYSSRPCEKCKGTSVVVFDKDDKELRIRRGFLSNRIPTNSGINRVKQTYAKNRNREGNK